MIDLHSHILPGVDDGASDIDKSVELVRELCNAGVTDVVATPHYVDETSYNSKVTANTKLLKKLKTRLKKEKIDVQLYLGNEIYICNNILKLLNNGMISGLAGSKYLLVELPMSGEFPSYYDVLLELIREGYFVVLAHPERYASFQKDFSFVTELHNMGVLMQCNLGSFAGLYGKSAFKLASRMAKEDMIFAMGSDIHHAKGDKWIPSAIKKLGKFYDPLELDEILTKNAKKILL